MPDMDSADIEAFLAEPRDAVLSVRLGSGRTIGTPIWFRWVDGVARFQSPVNSSKTTALRTSAAASLCVHEQVGSLARYVTIEGPVVEIDFDYAAHIVPAARHYLGSNAPAFLRSVEDALSAGREWACFELKPTTVIAKTQTLY